MPDQDREQLTQFQSQAIGLGVAVAGVPTDVDGNQVSLVVLNQDTNTQLVSDTAVHTATGQYQYQLSVDLMQVLGNYQVTWLYAIGGDTKVFLSYFAIGGSQPEYDNLTDDLKAVVDSTWAKFADLFDSPSGGPNLQTYFQANWSRGRVAQCLSWGLDRINTAAQPYSQYSTDPTLNAPFPTAQWGALLRQATFVEALKHLRRSYVEQPDYQGSTISRLDRRDYMDRWGQVLADEEALMRPQLDIFKIKQMGLGRPSILVSGGVYGRYSPVNMPGMAGRPRFYFASY